MDTFTKELIADPMKGNDNQFDWSLPTNDLHRVRRSIWLIQKLLGVTGHPSPGKIECRNGEMEDLDDIQIIFHCLTDIHSILIENSKVAEARFVYLCLLAWNKYCKSLVKTRVMSKSLHDELALKIRVLYDGFWKDYETTTMYMLYIEATLLLCSSVPYVKEVDEDLDKQVVAEMHKRSKDVTKPMKADDAEKPAKAGDIIIGNKKFDADDIAPLLGFLIMNSSWMRSRRSNTRFLGDGHVKKWSTYSNALNFDQCCAFYADVLSICERLDIHSYVADDSSFMIADHPIIDLVHESIINKQTARYRRENDYVFPSFVWIFTREQAKSMLMCMFSHHDHGNGGKCITTTKKTTDEVTRLALLADVKIYIKRTKKVDGEEYFITQA